MYKIQQVEKISLKTLLKPNAISLPLYAIFLAEAFFYHKQLYLGLGLHIINLISIVALAILAKYLKFKKMEIDRENLDYLQIIMLIPLLRIINTSIPVFFPLTIYWFPFIYAPMFIPIYLAAKNQGYTKDQIGLESNLRRNVLYTGVGLLLGALLGYIEYFLLHPGGLVEDLSLSNFLKITLIMFLFIGLVEELIFRSLLQTKLEQLFNPTYGLIIASLIFAAMHSGYSLPLEIIFAASAGLIIGYLFQRTRNLYFITTIHGTINVFLFAIIPLTI
ncbi:MAG: CPBP family intramembrane glutamic endopeptidase [Methanocellales archaeon]